MGWKADPDWEWHSAAEDTSEQLFALWREAVARSRSVVTESLAGDGLDRVALGSWPEGEPPSLRRLLIDLIEAFHVGGNVHIHRIGVRT